MGNGVSKKRNCEMCEQKIYDKSGKEIVVLDHVNYCREKSLQNSDRIHTSNRIFNLTSEISDLNSRLFASDEAKRKSENLVALYKRTCSTEIAKFENENRIKDSQIEELKNLLLQNSNRIKNQTANLNGIQRRHQESLQKNRTLENKVSQLQSQGVIELE